MPELRRQVGGTSSQVIMKMIMMIMIYDIDDNDNDETMIQKNNFDVA